MAQQAAAGRAPLAAERPLTDVSALYDEAIEGTIAQSKLLQNAKVLAAIEKQWRQSLRRMQAELKRAAAASRGSAAAAAASRVGPPAASASSVSSSASLWPQPVTHRANAAAAAAAGSDRDSSALHMQHTSAGSAGPPAADGTSADSTQQATNGQTEKEKEDSAKEDEESDDEFADAEVDEAEETPSLLASKASAETDQQQQQQQQQVNAVNGRSEEGKAAAGEEAHANKGEGAEQTNDSEDDQEEGAGMTLDDVSDLDDREPPTSDGIFAFYEKVERAAAGAARRTSKWKVLLRYGILRVGGREIAFDRITGEFSF